MTVKPKIKAETERLDVFLDIILLGFVLATIIIPLYHLVSLPDKIPLHFDIKGNADSYGSKYYILLVSGLSIGLAFVLWWIRRYPHLMNFPYQITEKNAAINYRMVVRFLNITNILTTSIFLIVILLIVSTANGNGGSFYTILLYVDIAAIFVAMIIYFVIAGKVNKKISK